MSYFKTLKTAKATAGTTANSTRATVSLMDTITGRTSSDVTIAQRMGALLLFATVAWSVYVNIGSFGAFLVMYSETFVTHGLDLSGEALVSSFVLGLAAIPLFVLGVILRRGAPGGSALKWGLAGLVTSVLSALAWLVVVIMIAIWVGLF